jgi:heme oxygenase
MPSHHSTPDSVSYGPSPALTPSFEVNTPDDVTPVPELISLIQRIDTSDPKKSLQALDVPDLDFSRNVSALLKDGTARAHVQAENSQGAAALVKGELGLEEYIRWLAVLWRLYE